MNLRTIISFKLDELRYAKRTQTLMKFILSNMTKERRSLFYSGYLRRGLDSAVSMGIKVPSDFPIVSLCEVFFERIYDVEGYIPTVVDTVIDVGAHTGDWTVYCAKILQVKEIYAFEPLKENLFYAKSILELNGCDNAKIYPFALSDSNKESELEYSGTMLGEVRANAKKKVETIKFRTLDSLNLQCNILKIDVEGFELEVLKGAILTIRKFKPKIILETHTKKLRFECNKLLESEGYKVEIIGRMIKGEKSKVPSTFDEVVNLFYSCKNISKQDL